MPCERGGSGRIYLSPGRRRSKRESTMAGGSTGASTAADDDSDGGAEPIGAGRPEPSAPKSGPLSQDRPIECDRPETE
jgi:hypothetical protein